MADVVVEAEALVDQLMESTNSLRRIGQAITSGNIQWPEENRRREFVHKLSSISMRLGAGDPCTADIAGLEKDLLSLGVRVS